MDDLLATARRVLVWVLVPLLFALGVGAGWFAHAGASEAPPPPPSQPAPPSTARDAFTA